MTSTFHWKKCRLSLSPLDLAQLDSLRFQYPFVFHCGFDLQCFLCNMLSSIQPLLDYADVTGRPRVLLDLSHSTCRCTTSQVGIRDSVPQVLKKLWESSCACVFVVWKSQKTQRHHPQMTVFSMLFPDCFSKPCRGVSSPPNFNWGASWPRGPPRNSLLPKRPLFRDISQENPELSHQNRKASVLLELSPRTAPHRHLGTYSDQPASQRLVGSPTWRTWMCL